MRKIHAHKSIEKIDVVTETWKYEQNILPNLKLKLYKSYSSSRNHNETKLFQAQKRYGYGYLLESSSGLVDSAVTVLASNNSTETIQDIILPWNKGDYNAHFLRYDNCLLYTSPSPRDKRQSRMPSSA